MTLTLQSTTAVLFSAPRNKFSLSSNRNKINSTISDFHNIAKRLSGDDESGLLKAVLKKDPPLCKALFNEHLLKYIMAKTYPSEYLSPEVLSVISNNRNISQSTQHAVLSQTIDRKLWSLENAEHMFIHLGDGLSEQDYDGLEHALRASNRCSQIPKLSALKRSLEKFKELVEPTLPNKTKGFRIKDIKTVLKDQLFETSLESDLSLFTISPDEIDVIIGEGCDTFSNLKGLKQNYKVFAVCFIIPAIFRNGKRSGEIKTLSQKKVVCQ